MKEYVGHISLFCASFIWGVNAPLTKNTVAAFDAVGSMNNAVDPLTHSLMRWGGAMVFFWILSFFTPREKVRKKDWPKIFWAAMFAVVCNQSGAVFGLLNASPVNISLISSMAPILTMILAAFVLHEPLTGKKIFGVSLGALGAVILVFASRAGSAASGSLFGDFMGFIAMLSFVLYLTLFSDIIERYSPVTLMKWLFTFSFIVGLPVCLPFAVEINYGSLTVSFWWQMLFVVFGATFLAYFLMPVGQKVLRPTVVSMYNYVQPIVATLLALMMGMEQFNVLKLFATLLIFVGVYFVIKSKSRAEVLQEHGLE